MGYERTLSACFEEDSDGEDGEPSKVRAVPLPPREWAMLRSSLVAPLGLSVHAADLTVVYVAFERLDRALSCQNLEWVVDQVQEACTSKSMAIDAEADCFDAAYRDRVQ